MKRYIFSDGKVIKASSDEEFIKKMRNTSFSESSNEKEFMIQCSERGKKLGLDIRYDTVYNFVSDLTKSGIVFCESDLDCN